jgi:phage gp16-like protein
MAMQGNLLDASIPLSVKPVVVDGVGAAYKGYDMRGKMIEEQHQEQTYQREDTDRSVIDSYMQQPDSNLSTAPGVEKALGDLKGKVSSDTYLKLSKHADAVRSGDLKFKDDITKLDEDNLKLRAAQMEKTLTYLAQPLDVYEKTLATKGKPDADAEFTKTRTQVLQAAAQEKDSSGKPVYPPELLQQLAAADPQTLKAMLYTTKYHKDLVDERYKESQTKRNDSLGRFDDARAAVYESGGTLSGSKTELARIEEDVKAGRLTPEEGARMKAGIVAKKAAPGDVSGLTPEAVDVAAHDYYISGNLPARLSPAERTKILNRAAEVAHENGDTAEETTARAAAGKSAKVAMTDITKRKALVETFEKDADKRLGFILELAKKADQHGVPALTRWINAGRQNIEGDADVTTFNSAMISLQAELAKVLSGSLGNAGVSDSARQEAGQIINKYMSISQLDTLVPNIRRELKFKTDSYDEELKDLGRALHTPKGVASIDHNKVDPQVQKERDGDGKTIMLQEYKKLKGELAAIDSKSPATADAYSRKKGDVEAAKRELERQYKIKDPDSLVDAAPAAASDVPPDIAAILQKHGVRK